MTREVLFVQGAGVRVHDEWDNQLAESLTRELGPGYDVRYPRMPGEDDPKFEAWKVALEEQFEGLRDGAIVVGHSVGGTILINAVAENPPALRLGAIFLVAAPFVGDGGWPANDGPSSEGIGAKLPRGVPIYLYHGLADSTVPPSHVDLYARAIPGAHVFRLAGRDHQLNNDLREIADAIKNLVTDGRRAPPPEDR